jgi:hypothetical protein
LFFLCFNSSMSAQLAIPTFIGGAKDALAAVDIYDAAGDAVINSIQDVYLDAPTEEDVLEVLGGSAMAQAAEEALAGVTGALPTEADVLAQIQSVAPGMSAGLLDMTAGAKDSLLSSVQGALGSVTSLSPTMITGLAQGNFPLAAGASFVDAKAITGMINGLSGGTPAALTLVNPGAMVSTLSSLVNQAQQHRHSQRLWRGDVLRRHHQQFGASAGSILTQMASKCLPTAVANGDIFSIGSMASALPSGALQMLSPSLIPNFSANFKMPAGSPVSSFASMYTTVQSTFNAVNPSWNTCSRLTSAGPQVSPSIVGLQGMSPDMARVIQVGAMLSADPLQKLQLLTTAIPSGSAIKSLSSSFPKTVLSAGARLAAPVVSSLVASSNLSRLTSGNPTVSTTAAFNTPWDSDQVDAPKPTEEDVWQAIYNDPQHSDMDGAPITNTYGQEVSLAELGPTEQDVLLADVTLQ